MIVDLRSSASLFKMTPLASSSCATLCTWMEHYRLFVEKVQIAGCF